MWNVLFTRVVALNRSAPVSLLYKELLFSRLKADRVRRMVNRDSTLVRLMHYDPRWRQEYKQTRSSLLYACEGWLSAVEHVGSTAIPGMIAQPTVDVLAGVKHEDELQEAAIRIEGLNFVSGSTDLEFAPPILLTKPRHLLEGQQEPTHRVYLTIEGSPLWLSMITLRDYLRRLPEAALHYEEVKMLHWKRSQGDREQYEVAKSSYLTHLIDQVQTSNDTL